MYFFFFGLCRWTYDIIIFVALNLSLCSPMTCMFSSIERRSPKSNESQTNVSCKSWIPLPHPTESTSPLARGGYAKNIFYHENDCHRKFQCVYFIWLYLDWFIVEDFVFLRMPCRLHFSPQRFVLQRSESQPVQPRQCSLLLKINSINATRNSLSRNE